MTRTLSIAVKENTYQDLKQKIGPGKISSFVNKAVEKELSELEKKEQQQREELRQKLIELLAIRPMLATKGSKKN